MLEEILRTGFSQLNLPCDVDMLREYRMYCDYLLKTNEIMNLTAILNEDDTARLHFLDCAALLNCVDFSHKQVIDIGTGAGFPGLALKIANKTLKVTLLDSLDKRIAFLKKTCEMLNIRDINCLHGRAEEIEGSQREHFDIACSRAVAKLNTLCEICLPYVKVGGYFVAMKGPDVSSEVEEALTSIIKTGGVLEKTVVYTVPTTDIKHSAVIIRKVNETPLNYPRRWAMIKKNPL